MDAPESGVHGRATRAELARRESGPVSSLSGEAFRGLHVIVVCLGGGQRSSDEPKFPQARQNLTRATLASSDAPM
jgi:hypothetical protein